MQFKFSGLSHYEQDARTNFMSNIVSHSVVLDFENIEAAIQYAVERNNYMITNDGKFAFVVRNIAEM